MRSSLPLPEIIYLHPLTPGCGHDNANNISFLFVSVFQLGGGPPSAKKRFHRLSVLGAHAVVDEDVEGGVDVRADFQEPGRRKKSVLVAPSRIQLWHEQQNQPALT